MEGVKAGEECVVQKDVVIDGKTAFYRGNYVKVERIVPDPETTGRRFEVHSALLDRLVQLSDSELMTREECERSRKKRNTGLPIPLAGVKKRCSYCYAPVKTAEEEEPVCGFCRKRLAAGLTPTWQDRAKSERSSFLAFSAIILVLYVITVVIFVISTRASGGLDNSEYQALRTISEAMVIITLVLAVVAIVKVGRFLEYTGGEWAGAIVAGWLCWLFGYLLVFASVMSQFNKVFKGGYPRQNGKKKAMAGPTQ